MPRNSLYARKQRNRSDGKSLERLIFTAPGNQADIMRIASSIAIGLALALLPPIGSGGTGTVKPQASHVDRALFTDSSGKMSDLQAADDAVTAAVIAGRAATGPRQD